MALIGLVAATIKKKDVRTLFPLVPLSFAYAFQYDMFYGSMMERAQIEADSLIVNDPLKIALPVHSGIVSREEYNQIMRIKDGKKVI